MTSYKKLINSNLRLQMTLGNPEELSATIREMGFADVANEFDLLLGKSKKSFKEAEIPLFYEIENINQTKYLKEIANFIFKSRKKAHIQHLITKTHILKLQTINSIDDALEILGEERSNFIDKNFRATFERNGEFDKEGFIEVIKNVSIMQATLMLLMEIDPFIEEVVSEQTLQTFVTTIIPSLEPLKVLEDSLAWYTDYYVLVVVKTLIFYFGSFCYDQVNLYEMVSSPMFLEFMRLDQSSASNSSPTQNPFAIRSTITIYNAFVKQDTEGQGLLTKANMKRTMGFEFSNAFLDALFDQLPIFEGKVDFSLYCAVVIPMQRLDTRNGSKFVFDILDGDGDGIISPEDMAIYYKSLAAETRADPSGAETFAYEMLDIVGAPAEGATLDVIMASGAQNTFFLRLIDVVTFIDWEGRH